MWPFSRIKNQADSSSEHVELSASDVLLQTLLSGKTVTKEMALGIPHVNKAVNKIANTVAVIPFRLYSKEVTKTNTIKIKESNDNRTALINNDTGDTLDGFQFKKALVTDYLLGKGGYAYINRRMNKIVSLHYVKEEKISFFTNSDAIFKDYCIYCNGKRFFDYEFLKICRDTKNGYSSDKIISELAKAIEAAFSTLKYQLKLTKTGGVKKGFLQAENKLDQNTIDILKAAFRNLYSETSENVIVLNKGIKFQEASQSAIDMQLQDIKKSLNNDIDAAFGIYLKDEEFLKYTILPIISAIETALNKSLLLESEKDKYYFAADVRALDKMDQAKQYNSIKSAQAAGMTYNEARYLMNLTEYDGLDKIPLSLGSSFFDVTTSTFYTPNNNSYSNGETPPKEGKSNEE